ncbi:Structural maintenance of chromosomes protein 6 [Ophidiomyces ophidiicola]|nr:Structural maintenance of chromosomes protein 6 [Ophidiomyces ophidiicola]
MAPEKRSHDFNPPFPSKFEQRKRRRLSPSSSIQTSSDFEGDVNSDFERHATQMFREKYQTLGDNQPVENGIIERIDCYNFMCHKHLSLELGPLINFIVGKNGSGKSAVLTALALCLGGKASATNRGQSLKNFIKEGNEYATPAATIIVRIKNQGGSAYLPHEFGSSIIVERHFSLSGASGFRIKNVSGRVVTTKRSDLDSIIDYFALQMDNPMNVLSQDMARQFLSTSNPAEKYKFFVKGVQLEQLDQDYHLIDESINSLESKLGVQYEELKVLEERKSKTKTRLALSDRHEGIRNRIRNLRAQMAWAQVDEQEQIRDALGREYTELHKNLVHLEAAAKTVEHLFDEVQGACLNATNQLQIAENVLERVRDSKKEVQARHDAKLNECQELHAIKREVRNHLKAADNRIQETRKKIEEELQKLKDVDGGVNIGKLDEIEEKEAAAKEAWQRHKDHKDATTRLQSEIATAENLMNRAGLPIPKQRKDIDEADQHLRSMERGRQHQEGAFPAGMTRLIKVVQEDSTFNRQPIGPVGSYITLLKPQWSSVLEKSFGNTLNGFVVTSKNDLNKLSSIMRRVDCVCPIFIGNENGTLDTSPYEPDARFDTALRVLKIDIDIVRRQLVINHSIEQMLLIEDVDEASKIMYSDKAPKNVRRCYCIDKNDRRRGVHLGFTRTGDPVQSPLGAFAGQARMKTDIDSQIRIQRDAINGLRNNLRVLENEQRDARSNLEKCRQAFARHERRQRDLQIEAQKADDLVEELKDAMEMERVEDGRLDGLKHGLAESEEEKRIAAASYEDGVIAHDAAVVELKKMKKELAAKDAEIASAEHELLNYRNNKTRAEDEQRRVLSEMNVALVQVNAAGRNVEKTTQKQNEAASRVIKFTKQAEIISSLRVVVDEGETSNSLDEKLQKLKHDLQRYDTEMGASREDIAAAAAEAEAKYELSRAQITDFSDLAQESSYLSF